MNLAEIGKKIAQIGAPLLGGIIAGPAGAKVAQTVLAVLGLEPDAPPELIAQALERDPGAAVKLAELESNTRIELQKLAVSAEAAEQAAAAALHAETQATARAEIASNDPFVRRARPTLIYIAGACLSLMVLGAVVIAALAIVTFDDVSDADKAIRALAAVLGEMQTVLAIALGAAGMYIHRRSHDKEVAHGMKPRGLLDVLTKRADA